MRSAFDAFPDEAVLVDAQSIILAANTAWLRFFEANSCGRKFCFEGVNYLEICRAASGPDGQFARQAADGIAAVLAGQITDFRLEYPCNSPLEKRWFGLHARRLQGADGGALILHRNITEQKGLNSLLRRNYQSYAAAFHASESSMWEWRTSECVMHVRDADDDPQEPSTGMQFADWLGQVHPKDRAILSRALRACAEGASAHLRVEHRQRDAENRWRWIVTQGVVIEDEASGGAYVVGSQSDVTRRREREDDLERAALHDALTGLPNRALLLRRLSDHLQDPEQAGVGMLFLDLDGFKAVNDHYGHGVGDRVLNRVAQRLEVAVRSQDTLARLGGDEFAVLLDGVSQRSEVEAAAVRLCVALQAPIDIDGQRLPVGVSVGGWLHEGEAHTAEEVLAEADRAMYEVKRSGKGGFLVLDGASRRKADHRPRRVSAARVARNPRRKPIMGV
ncbi:MAG: diguanylate cyclase [Acidobacteria bacterium]|nr:diguanylate cyclase [Acidobacteriota bacterium]